MISKPAPVHLVPAGTVTLATRVAILNSAYTGYYFPINVTADQLAVMDRAFDVDLVRSLVAIAGDEPVGLASVGVRVRNAWIGGVGVLSHARQQGVARAMIDRIVETLAEIGTSEIALEVVSANAPALGLYESFGFRVHRELLTWRRDSDADPLPIPAAKLVSTSPGILLQFHESWHDQPTCWQAESKTLGRLTGRIKGFLLETEDGPSAYCLINDATETVWLLDVAIRPGSGETTSGRVLLQAVAAIFRGRPLEIANVPADSRLNRILAALRFLVVTRQVEMKLHPLAL